MITVNSEIERISNLHITLCENAVEQNVATTEQQEDTNNLPLFNPEDVLTESKAKKKVSESPFYSRRFKVVFDGHKRAKVYPDFLTLWKEATGSRKACVSHKTINAWIIDRLNQEKHSDFPAVKIAYRMVRETNQWEQIYPVVTK